MPQLDAFPAQTDSPVFPRCDRDAVPWVTVAQMREVDRITIGMGVTLERMMENAGAHLALPALGRAAGPRCRIQRPRAAHRVVVRWPVSAANAMPVASPNTRCALRSCHSTAGGYAEIGL